MKQDLCAIKSLGYQYNVLVFVKNTFTQTNSSTFKEKENKMLIEKKLK